MTSIINETYIIPAADLGPENPLPMFRARRMDAAIDFEKWNVPPEDRPGLGWQVRFRVLPHRIQDGYNRTKRPRKFASIVLENEYLRVCVLPEVGGKVTSIFYKPLNRELLLYNPVFQPGNLALRNAWTAGGIEWNTPHIGHHCLACSPVHAAVVNGTNGNPVLRLYAWERMKCFPFSIDLHLPEGSRFLFAHIRIINPHRHEIPMYWWTNVGVPEYHDGRVLCPADTAYHGAVCRDCPVINNIDHSYATRISYAYDLFFRIPEEQRRWVAIVDREGTGLIHTSTARLKGRKMFAWGMGPGSRTWNDFLIRPGMAFQEIQAGLARTQLHSVPMPPETEWSWTEAFGCLESDPRITHAPDWHTAYGEVDRILEKKLPQESVDQFHSYAVRVSAQVPDEIRFRGLGWGALERRRARIAAEQRVIPESMPFAEDESGVLQEPWLSLLERGRFPAWEANTAPGEYMIQNSWRVLLEASLRAEDSGNWLAWYHLGVMKMEDGDEAGARKAWEASNRLTANAWSLRNLAVLALRSKQNVSRVALLEQAWGLSPGTAALAIELGNALVENERWDELRGFLSRLPGDILNCERIRLLMARLALRSDDFELAEQMFGGQFATIREGETALTNVWFELQARKVAAAKGIAFTESLLKMVRREYKPPACIDFRMSTDEDHPYVAPQMVNTDETD